MAAKDYRKIQFNPIISAIFCILLLFILSVPAFLSDRAVAASSYPKNKTPLILISIDGFRADYIKRGVTPHLLALANNGTYAKIMHPSFPSITFPNHYTLVTGLYPDHHGIVGNTMDDMAIKPDDHFKMSDHQAVVDHRWWDEAEPLWVTAEKQGIVSATMFWPGSEADIHGIRPEMWRRFNGHVPFSERVDQVISWLDYPSSHRPQFVTLYFENVDHIGHVYGPDSPEMNENLTKVDQAIGQLVQELTHRHINANLVIVSDHGMAATASDRAIILNKVIPSSRYRLITSGAYAGIEPAAGQDISALFRHHDHMQCWPKNQIPPYLHYGHNPRVPSVICIADVGWSIIGSENAMGHIHRGNHGYDNMTPEMGALFIANGPAFKRHAVIDTMDNIDVQPLVAHVLGVKIAKGDSNITPKDMDARFLIH
ncbi:MAG: ectonucleotide pyrophosphatase/phosphodiesterase [Zymomonas mobilis subsp. pomaceae]|uniref:Nucleotide diphosphatase n=1 Tax=Zymomonas mobilis subsp. pomaceae (strain ATCC 29192 / DSM 22645 / JCM 10191 / CCUG 17912 / NBRC 13757 / NCIMB 11200 / NRRL B-4491 / Barker I) TaxID=579138 RepID=F8EVR0_ZYMMT|nr:ectonucleotide pyrophosphatase/phosphodiesterase [Zymomonas mobilis]AEI38397.1 Nucleotide diphosphatase [Zymomonas mobilis subsp. pomaceae ATCC 29192]MDX5948087.1 ectonucleotide pyrophosphatase/phosphodiesterase [Zymomonas mobilis subsp. pomaceae]GEB89416.1 alkaline phosphatase family protein [Zymomonas mobilis subsp. pomaceae]